MGVDEWSLDQVTAAAIQNREDMLDNSGGHQDGQ
jgi:hypothetical protein